MSSSKFGFSCCENILDSMKKDHLECFDFLLSLRKDRIFSSESNRRSVLIFSIKSTSRLYYLKNFISVFPNSLSELNNGYGLLHIAIDCSNNEALKLLIENGGDVNAKGGHNLLLYSFIQNQYSCVEILLSYGADPNWKDIEGETLLDNCYILYYHICGENKEEFGNAIHQLLLFGADPYVKDSRGVCAYSLFTKYTEDIKTIFESFERMKEPDCE